MGILKTIFGGGDVVNKGFQLIDELHTSDEEKAEAKIKLMKAYAPFRIAQRYLALIFSFNFTIAFQTALVMSVMGKDIEPVVKVATSFQLGYIVITIVLFYFGGGALEGVLKKAKR